MKQKLLTPMVYDLADALEIDMKVDYSKSPQGKLYGTRTGVITVFEGYSPTVITEVITSAIYEGLIAVCVSIWGNLNVMCINDGSMLSLFVYDRSKVVSGSVPFSKDWSRQHTYKFLDSCIKGVYWRYVSDPNWTKLDKGVTKLRLYNDMRYKNTDSNTAYMAMWGDL